MNPEKLILLSICGKIQRCPGRIKSVIPFQRHCGAITGIPVWGVEFLMETDRKVADILFKGGDIFTLDAANPWIRNGAIAVGGAEILAVGTPAGVENNITAATRTVDFSGLTVMPGLVDGHNHLFQHLGKTLGDGLSLLPWLSDYMMPLAAEISREEAVHAVRLGALNSVLCGTTAIVDNHYAPVDEETVIGVADALEEIGVRGCRTRHLRSHGGRRQAHEQ